MQIKRFSYCWLMVLLFLSCGSKDALLFIQMDAKTTGIDFVNHSLGNDSINILTYPYLYNGAGVAVADFNNDGKEDIFLVGNKKGSSKLYFNESNFKFTEVTKQAGVAGFADWQTGVSTVDINGDGWMDIYVSTVSIPGIFKSANELYLNNKNGTFTEAAKQYGLNFAGHTTQAAFFDYDNDGDLDCFLLNHPVSYTDDYKTVAQREIRDSLSGDKLMRNDNGVFTDVTRTAGIYSSNIAYGLGIAVGDLNNDGWMDIYVSNDFKENDYCYINNGNGTFSEKVKDLFGHTSRFSMGNDMADYNNDGWPDVMTLDMLSRDEKVLKSSVADDDIETYDYKHHFGFHYQFSKNCLQQNIDGKYFADKGLQSGVAATDWSWSPLLADFDNDGYKDLFISNGFKYRVNDLDFNVFVQNTLTADQKKGILTKKYALTGKIPGGAVPDYFYLNDKEGGFSDASSNTGFTMPTLSSGAAYADLDNDGDLDLIVNRLDAPTGIYQNNISAKHYLQIKLKGVGQNTNGIGAKVYVFTQWNMQYIQQSTVRGFMSSISPLLHVGLGASTHVDSMLIMWSSGKGQWLRNVEADTLLVLNEKDASTTVLPYRPKHLTDTLWHDETAASGLTFAHTEDAFDDMARQPLLPHSLATQGPALAVADVNSDGIDDFFIGGAKGQTAALFLQNSNGFIRSMQPAFAADSLYEDVDALFFDADGDGDKDLYVVSGGNEWFGRNDLLNDRLYLNDGNGHFEKSHTVPPLYENKSCVAVCDWDKDGDIDLFVGGRANARMYGFTPSSVLLQNDGKGNFSEVTNTVAKGLQNAGMVTCAVWSDVDGNGWKDLIVAGEWMPVTLFKNNKGILEKQSLPTLDKSNGWWNCLYADDVDGDGDEDFLLGNWGTNTKLTATADFPLQMNLSDWNGNGETEPVLSVADGKNYYPFVSKTDLEKRMPFIKKQFLKYGDAAGKTTAELLGENKMKGSRKLVAYTLGSAVIWNDNGILHMQSLPSFLQAAPVFSFTSYIDSHKTKTYVAGGNFYEVSPYEGRYDAMLPVIFRFEKHEALQTGLIPEKGCVRRMQSVTMSNGKPALLMARNNDSLTLFKTVK